ncbi:MAG: hypothetical protein OXH75_15625 [Acidobacteria bacterium]|nr:hypothetical protein [Acidobacteriota bacterium]
MNSHLTGFGIAITVRLHDEREHAELTDPRDRFVLSGDAARAALLLLEVLEIDSYAEVRVVSVAGGFNLARWTSVTDDGAVCRWRRVHP